MKLSNMRPDWAQSGNVNGESHRIAVEAVKDATGETVVVNPQESQPPGGDANETTGDSDLEKSNTQPALYVRQRITQINEAMAAIQAEGADIPEWEAANMLIRELELVLENDPSFKRNL